MIKKNSQVSIVYIKQFSEEALHEILVINGNFFVCFVFLPLFMIPYTYQASIALE